MVPIHVPRTLPSRILHGLTLFLALILPFEVIQQTWTLPWIELTNLELLVYVTALVFIAELATKSGRRHLKTVLRTNRMLLIPAFVFVLIALLSALLAPSHRFDALKFVARLFTGLYAAILIAYVIDTHTRLAGIVWVLALGAGISALLGFGEVAGLNVFNSVLSLFKAAPSRVGGTIRLSASFQYTTIASMFFEMVVPLAIALAVTAEMRIRRLGATAVVTVCIIAIVLTLTRTGMVTVAVAMGALFGATLWQARLRTLRWPALLGGATLVLVIGALAVGTTTFRTRLTTENDLNWYGATYSVPPTLTITANASEPVTVTVQNTGEATWHPSGANPFVLGYYWLTDDGENRIEMPHTELSLPRDVPPGDRIEMTARLTPTLPAGDYQLAWGMLQRDILWFRHRDVPEATTDVTVEPATEAESSPPAPTAPRDEPESDQPATVERRTLWRVALQMWSERPLLGIGPDNFRHTYGSYLGLTEWDEGLHANNTYLEMLADVGLLGAAAFAWLLGAAAFQVLTLLRATQSRTVALWAACIGGSLLAFVVHGLLDYFLEFAPTSLLFWMVIGYVAALRRLDYSGNGAPTESSATTSS